MKETPGYKLAIGAESTLLGMPDKNERNPLASHAIHAKLA